MTWAMLIKAVFEVDPLKCPKCGGTMKIISFIEEGEAIPKVRNAQNFLMHHTIVFL